MQIGRGGATAGQDERLEWSKICIDPVNLRLQPRDLSIGHREPRTTWTLFGKAEIGLDIEKIVLDTAKRSIERFVAFDMQAYQANHSIDLVDRAVGLDADVVFLAPGTGAKRSRSVLPGPRLDAGEQNHIDLVVPFSQAQIWGRLILAFFSRRGDAHAYTDDCDCSRLPGPAGLCARTGLRSRQAFSQGRHGRLFSCQEEEVQKAEGKSGVYARCSDEVSVCSVSSPTNGRGPRSSP